MKKLFSMLVLLPLLTNPALASETLTTPYVSAGGVTSPQITMWGKSQMADNTGNLNAGFISITYKYGTATVQNGKDQSFAVDPNAPVLTNTLNLSTGVWVLTSNISGQLATGQLLSAQLPYAIAAFNGAEPALRNFADQFLLGVIPGTQVDTW